MIGSNAPTTGYSGTGILVQGQPAYSSLLYAAATFIDTGGAAGGTGQTVTVYTYAQFRWELRAR